MFNVKQMVNQTSIEATNFQPTIFDLANEQDALEMAQLVNSGVVRHLYDTLLDQLSELVETRQPHLKNKLSQSQITTGIERILANRSLQTFGRWVYYPWSGDLVHVLPPDAFRELRLNRNHYKITPEEQALLAKKTVGIVGLSVGNAVALTLAMEGACGHLKLADFDELSLSNMNRIRAGIKDIGIKKTVLAARQIFEFNPYAQISLFSDGLTEDNLDSFFKGAPQLDILIDECDGLRMKFTLRERARQLGIPVLMETSDRGMVDVERYDIEPNRPIFHGLIGDVCSADIPAKLSDEDKVKYALPILGIDTISTRLAASLVEIEKSISTWPQLCEDVALGGAVMTAAVRHLALEQPLPSGRRFLDMSAFLQREPASSSNEVTDDLNQTQLTATEATALPTVMPPFIEQIVENGILAPSGGNCQPWQFEYDGHLLWVKHDKVRSKNLLDVDHRAAYIALGAAIENMVVAAAHQGYATQIVDAPAHDEPNIVAGMSFSKDEQMSESKTAVLYPQIRRRLTNRNNGVRTLIPHQMMKQLETAVASYNCEVNWLTEEADLAEISHILGEGDRLRFLCAELHAEVMAELRWSEEETIQSKDGIDIDTLSLSEAQATALNVIRRPDVVALLRQMGGGQALSETTHKAINAASAVGLIIINRHELADLLNAGRGIEQMWLQATQLELSLHPMTTIIYMFDMLTSEAAQIFQPAERQHLLDLKSRFETLFPNSQESTNLLLFRLSSSVEEPTTRSLRMPIHEVLHFAQPPQRHETSGRLKEPNL